MTTAKGRSLMYLRTASARPVENKSILLLKDEKLKLMNFCFWFLFRPVTDSLQHRETIQFKSVLRCCLYTKNNCKNFHFCPQREKQSLLLAQLVFLLFAGSSRSKTQLAELPDFSHQTSARVYQPARLTGVSSLGSSRQPALSLCLGTAMTFHLPFPRPCTFVCLDHRGGTVSGKPVLCPTRVVPLRRP